MRYHVNPFYHYGLSQLDNIESTDRFFKKYILLCYYEVTPLHQLEKYGIGGMGRVLGITCFS